MSTATDIPSETTLPPQLVRDVVADDDVRILDVRTPGEFEEVHIPGSYNVPLDTLGEHADEIRRHVDDRVVLVCRSGQRAARAEQRLSGTGMPNVHVLDGGIQAWESSGGEVRRGEPRWDLERQVRLVAGSVIATSVIGSIWWKPLRFIAGAMGVGLTTAAVRNSCTLGMLLSRLPYNRGPKCDIDDVLDQLANG